MQNQLLQASVYLYGVLSDRVLLKREKLRVLGWTEQQNRVFPNFNSEYYRHGFCLRCEVPQSFDRLAHFSGIVIVSNRNGHLGLHDRLTDRAFQVAKYGLHSTNRYEYCCLGVFGGAKCGLFLPRV